MRFWLYCASIFVWLGSCAEKKQTVPPRQEPPPIWAEYKVWAAEGDSMATCLVQFYDNTQKRQSLWLTGEAQVQVDGLPLQGDSAGIAGAYYEFRAPIATFAGSHAIVFTDPGGQSFTDTFSFYVLRLAEELPDVLPESGHELLVEGLPDGSQVRVVMTDTSFSGEGYNEMKTLERGRLVLGAADFAPLHPGPVVLHLSVEEERPLRSRLRGSFSLTYELTRSFELRKAPRNP